MTAGVLSHLQTMYLYGEVKVHSPSVRMVLIISVSLALSHSCHAVHHAWPVSISAPSLDMWHFFIRQQLVGVAPPSGYGLETMLVAIAWAILNGHKLHCHNSW